jgi:hypothetical protein
MATVAMSLSATSSLRLPTAPTTASRASSAPRRGGPRRGIARADRSRSAAVDYD